MIASELLLPRIAPLIANSRVALALADLAEHDLPLQLVNRSFESLCGYASEEVLGRNCRFLQPPGGAGPVRQAMRAFLGNEGRASGEFVVPNVRKDGSRFLNLLYMAKLRHKGRGVFVLGSQFALPARNQREALYERALQEHVVSESIVLSDSEFLVLSSARTIANSITAVAQVRLDGSI